MARLTRRGLIKQASVGAGVTGVLVAAVVTGSHFEAPSAHSTTTTANTSQEPLVVCINDPASGTLVLMQGENQITVNNPGLVQSLLSL